MYSRGRMTRAFSWVFLLGVLLVSAPVFAADAADKASEKEAATRFQRGVGLYKDGDYEAALTEFKAAYRLAPFYEVLYNLGLTQRRLFQYGEAVKSLNDYLVQGGKKVTAARREAVKKELDEIRQLTAEVMVVVAGTGEATLQVDGVEVAKTPLKEPLLLRPGKHTITATRGEETASETPSLLTATRVTINLEPKRAEGKLIIESDPPGAIISVDGTLQGEAPVVTQVGVGAHTITADRDGYQTANLEVTLSQGQSRQVTVKLTPGGNGGGSDEAPRARKFPLVGVLVSVAGLALIGGAVGFNFQAQGAAQQLTAVAEMRGSYDAAAQKIEATGQTASALSWVFGLTGGAVVGTGLILLLVDLTSAPAEPVSFFISPTPNGAFAAWRFSW